MRRSRAVFCLLARNVASDLPALRVWLMALASRFLDHRVIVVENDSVDDTPTLLTAWRVDNPQVIVVSAKLGLPAWPQNASLERAAQLAELRNCYLDYLQRLDFAPDFVVVVDADLPRGVSPEGFSSSFGYEDWDLMASNGIMGLNEEGEGGPRFFDAWAFREHSLTEPRSFEQINSLHFRPGMPPFPVRSAFGGLAIYRSEALRTIRYAGDDCEHVTLHRAMRDDGYDRLFLNPSSVVLY